MWEEYLISSFLTDVEKNYLLYATRNAYVKCVKNIKRIRVGEGVERALNTVRKYVKIRGQLIYVLASISMVPLSHSSS